MNNHSMIVILIISFSIQFESLNFLLTILYRNTLFILIELSQEHKNTTRIISFPAIIPPFSQNSFPSWISFSHSIKPRIFPCSHCTFHFSHSKKYHHFSMIFPILILFKISFFPIKIYCFLRVFLLNLFAILP